VPPGTAATRTIRADGTPTTLAMDMASTTATTRTRSRRREMPPGGRRSGERRSARDMASRRRRLVGRRLVGRQWREATRPARASRNPFTARRTATSPTVHRTGKPVTVRSQDRTRSRTSRRPRAAFPSAPVAAWVGPRCGRCPPAGRHRAPAGRVAMGHGAEARVGDLRFRAHPAARVRVGREVPVGQAGRVVPVVRVAVVRVGPVGHAARSVGSVGGSAAATTKAVPVGMASRGRRGPRRLAGETSSWRQSRYSS
jgi:hypothetical protein